MSRAARTLVAATALATTAIVTGCQMAAPPPPEGEVAESPRIFPPPLPDTRLRPDPARLPEGARAMLPATEADAFFVALPKGTAQQLSAAEVFEKTVAPVLEALGMDDVSRRIRVPDNDGVEQPRANLEDLAALTCLEFAGAGMPGAQRVCDVMTGAADPDDAIDATFQGGEGMSFAQFAADVERLELEYFFPQRHAGVPIEHVGVRAARWDGETITSVTGRVITRYRVTNAVTLTPEGAARRAASVLAKVDGLCCPDREPPERVERLLLPFGEYRGLPALRYVYRMPAFAEYRGMRGLFYLWLDAESGELLELQPLIDSDALARGVTFRRAPDLLPAADTPIFRVDNATAGQFTLALSGVFNRVDRFGDGDYGDGEVSIPDDADGSSATFANFDQSGLNDPAAAVCSNGHVGFEQVDLMATASRHRSAAVAAGLFTPFPTAALDLEVESGSCGAMGTATGLRFGTCAGFTDPACPDAAGVALSLNPNQDHTIVAHELGHLMTPRQYTDRPPDWCVGPTLEGSPTMPCPVPTGESRFHDFADAWAHALESSNCVGGWYVKNYPGLNDSLNCGTYHSEGGGVPRLSEVTLPFDPAAPGDHFPEHRDLSGNGYADGQIAGAALWSLRQGMRSKCLPSGTPQYFVRFVRALRTTGWFGAPLLGTDRNTLRGLLDLEIKLASQWAASGSPGGPPGFAHNGAHTTNKVTGAFARSGVFMLPLACIDGEPSTTDPGFCPAGESGADAVIDIDDNDPADDPVIDGIQHPERDYLERGGPAPLFHVWTGPRYTLSGDDAVFPDPAVCNAEFRVEVANDDAFTVNPTDSGFLAVNLDPGDPDQCYGTWSLPAAAWDLLDDGGRLYYRVTTRDALGGHERLSTEPGNGLFSVPPPYAVINTLGTP